MAQLKTWVLVLKSKWEKDTCSLFFMPLKREFCSTGAATHQILFYSKYHELQDVRDSSGLKGFWSNSFILYIRHWRTGVANGFTHCHVIKAAVLLILSRTQCLCQHVLMARSLRSASVIPPCHCDAPRLSHPTPTVWTQQSLTLIPNQISTAIFLSPFSPRFNSWVGKIHWRGDRLPTPVFFGFLCGSVSKESACKNTNTVY